MRVNCYDSLLVQFGNRGKIFTSMVVGQSNFAQLASNVELMTGFNCPTSISNIGPYPFLFRMACLKIYLSLNLNKIPVVLIINIMEQICGVYF